MGEVSRFFKQKQRHRLRLHPLPQTPLTQPVPHLELHAVANIPPLAVADSVVIASDNALTRSHP